MENIKVIDERIADLKWRAMPLFDKLMTKILHLGDRLIRQSNLALVIVASGLIYLTVADYNYSSGLMWLFFSSTIMLTVLRIELSFRLMCLKEAKFLKKIKSKLSRNRSSGNSRE